MQESISELCELREQFYKLIERIKRKKCVSNKDIVLMSEICEQIYLLTDDFLEGLR